MTLEGTDRLPGSRYQPAGLFRRTAAERADQLLSWQRDELRAAYPGATVLDAGSDLETFCAENNHRLPEQFAHLPWQRAQSYIARHCSTSRNG